MSASQRAAPGPPLREDPRLAVDRLPPGGALEVIRLDDWGLGDQPVRAPHRHDYHELIWLSRGSGRHLIDGEAVAAEPPAITVIGRGQVHVFERAEGITGAVVRFGDEVLLGAHTQRIESAWLLAGRGGRTIPVPGGEAGRVDALVELLAAEAGRAADELTPDAQRHALSMLLLWIERWYEADHERCARADDDDVQLHRRFTALLESDFPAHHDAAHYADALAVPAAALSRTLARVTGRSTKELVVERVMLEAQRLLRFTDLTIGEVSFRVGFGDPLYFSRAFKRQVGEAPMSYRARVRGA